MVPTRSGKPGDDWMAVVRKNGTVEFADAFARDATLDAAVTSGPCVGVKAIAAFFAATAGGMYDALTFTHETVDGAKTYLEWEGKAFGQPVGGTTILTRDEAGLIRNIKLYHRPFQMVLRFSAELQKRLNVKVEA